MAKVSIIIPIYNAEKFLKDCLQSIINQTFQDLQVILVNDGSTDSSEQIIDEFVSNYPNIFIKINKENGGQATARNLGINYMTGEYVIFIDSDDFIEPSMIEELYGSAIKDNADIVVCDYYEIIDNMQKGQGLQETQKKYTKAFMNYSDDITINYMLSNPSPWNKLIKSDIIKQNSIFFLEKHIYEDLATMPLLSAYAKTIDYLEKPLYNYIIRIGSTMRQEKYNPKLDSIFVAMDHLKNQFISRNIIDKYSNELEFLFIYHLLYASSGRFLEYPEGKEKIKKIKNIIKDKYPNWANNIYYKKQSIIFKMTCKIFYSNNSFLINMYILARKIFKQKI